MIYKPGEMAESYGVKYDYKIVDAKDVDTMLKNGWYAHYQDFLNVIKEVKPKRIQRTKEQIETDKLNEHSE